jgi:hypothetical protein
MSSIFATLQKTSAGEDGKIGRGEFLAVLCIESESFVTSSDRQDGQAGFFPIALNFMPQLLQLYFSNQLVSIVTTGPPPEHTIYHL